MLLSVWSPRVQPCLLYTQGKTEGVISGWLRPTLYWWLESQLLTIISYSSKIAVIQDQSDLGGGGLVNLCLWFNIQHQTEILPPIPGLPYLTNYNQIKGSSSLKPSLIRVQVLTRYDIQYSRKLFVDNPNIHNSSSSFGLLPSQGNTKATPPVSQS